jgi:hypothetical protein
MSALPSEKKLHLLVHLHPLLFQQFEESAFWLLVIRLNKPETAIGRLLGHRFPNDDFEVFLLVLPFPYIAAVNSHRQRRRRTRQRRPILRGPLHEAHLLVA